MVAIIINHIRGLITPLITTQEPLSSRNFLPTSGSKSAFEALSGPWQLGGGGGGGAGGGGSLVIRRVKGLGFRV